ncbi:MAG TPA: phenylacetate-CoA oxygenase subunit PaaI [Cryomorphaceae bacterium]|nr:phenylacetate-CoA oxygenase subunit PaaI [Owenweeksia sp.]MBF98694.1 phenylacetate-CoA oxygenase subunit PaaI [Owenweeksia sp.]HAD96481.1 phenylacetate-CoA oxygenase subunit PaaI [Cryomorphaceae bacterium]HBF22127.1 phenylacetate-CoA oxygenase subunit PaaI [Cryomorphaceae bacterium]HCQ14998.1 phenylacetate-CoA oxygenase subunit PaaI [Cryomorphaceae bacterium]
MQKELLEYTLRLGDNALILGQRLGEWCGYGPILEQDIALSNIALDQLGQARMLLQYAAKLKGEGFTEDKMAFFRDVYDYHNLLMVELPNGHWGNTLVRQFLFDTFNYFLYTQLLESKDDHIRSVAQKAIKEITYHAQWSAEWVIRLGDGTEESHQKVQDALDDLWQWTGEMFTMDEVETAMLEKGIGADLNLVKDQWHQKVAEILEVATLKKPDDEWMQEGGKQGEHTEYLGYVLAEMQHLPRMHPDVQW